MPINFKGGLIGRKQQQELIEQQRLLFEEEQIERARQAFNRAVNHCLEKINDYLPSSKFSREEQIEVCRFLIEHRNNLSEKGYDTHFFLNMFSDMVEKMEEQQNANHDMVFLAVMRASKRLVQT